MTLESFMDRVRPSTAAYIACDAFINAMDEDDAPYMDICDTFLINLLSQDDVESGVQYLTHAFQDASTMAGMYVYDKVREQLISHFRALAAARVQI